MRAEPEPDPARREAEARRGARWLGAFLLPVPLGLALWRIDGLGMGATDVVPHFLLDLLVSGYLVLLLSGPLRGRPPLPAVGAALLLALALFVGWLYLPTGLGTAGTLVAATLAVGVALWLLREHLSSVTFLRSPWMEELGLAGRKVPADAVYAPDPLTGRAARTWKRYAAFPILAGFLMDHAGIGVPFWLSAILVLVTLPLTATLAAYVLDKNRTTGGALASAMDEITGEFAVVTEKANE